MTYVLQSRLLDTIRQELGGTYSITATPDAEKFPRAEYSVRIGWTCDPARTATLVQRVFEEIAFVRATPLSPEQVTIIRDGLLREFERNSQDNGYLLNQISRRYEDGDEADVAAVENLPERITALTGDAIQQAAQTYLDTANYVKVTLMPETK
jgi:zinc protease